MLGQYRVTAMMQRRNKMTDEVEEVESAYSKSFPFLSEALVWKAGLNAVAPDDRVMITDPDGFAVPQVTQDAYLRSMW